MTRQFAVSTVTTGSDTRGIGHDNTGRTRTDRGQAARSSELGSGDFRAVAKLQLWVVGERLVRRVGIGRDENVLDIACGTGNAALRAAAAGGRVVGVDLTRSCLLPVARWPPRPESRSSGSRGTPRSCRSSTSASTWCCRRSV
jgi:hypothetical protein